MSLGKQGDAAGEGQLGKGDAGQRGFSFGALIIPQERDSDLEHLLLFLLALCCGAGHGRDLINNFVRGILIKVLDSDSSTVGRDRREGHYRSFLQ